jgi:hypothetical protein
MDVGGREQKKEQQTGAAADQYMDTIITQERTRMVSRRMIWKEKMIYCFENGYVSKGRRNLFVECSGAKTDRALAHIWRGF